MDIDFAKKKMMKAQFWSFDIIFAIIIFTVAMTILAYAWYNINTQLALSYGSGTELMQFEAQALAEKLLTPGVPADWQALINTSNTSTWGTVGIGLTSTPESSALDPSKVYALLAMADHNSSDYQATKPLLGIGYDYYISITGKDINITIGSNPSSHGALTTYVYKDRSVFASEPVLMEIIVWTNEPIAIS
ncbi:MAG: hypothetical protein M1125_01165 [Candidatus Marsarchaeota archaeon]|nr:hypothetical protein [Candidatus Marsarchaeota archaeon]